ncbi:hypothetical protein [Dapis sp. BLCC M172]
MRFIKINSTAIAIASFPFSSLIQDKTESKIETETTNSINI